MSDPQEPRVSLSEIARQMREQKKANDSSQVSSSESVGSASSSAPSTKPSAQDERSSHTGLRALAKVHRLQTAALLLPVAAFFGIVFFFDPLAWRARGKDLPANVFLGSMLITFAATYWLAFRLYRWAGIMWAVALIVVLSFFPVYTRSSLAPASMPALLAFVACIALNSGARRRLAKAGRKVPLWGVSPSSMPE